MENLSKTEAVTAIGLNLKVDLFICLLNRKLTNQPINESTHKLKKKLTPNS